MLLHLDMKPWLQLPVRCCPLDLSLLSAEQDLMKMSPLLGAEILVRSREKLLQHINAGGSTAELDWTVGRRSCWIEKFHRISLTWTGLVVLYNYCDGFASNKQVLFLMASLFSASLPHHISQTLPLTPPASLFITDSHSTWANSGSGSVLPLRCFSVGCWWDLNLDFGLTHSETRPGSSAWPSDLPHYPESYLSSDSEANPSSWRGFQMTHSDRRQECGHEPYNCLIALHRHRGGKKVMSS